MLRVSFSSFEHDLHEKKSWVLCDALFGEIKTYFIFLRFYLFIHERQTERETDRQTQAEGEAGSMQGA